MDGVMSIFAEARMHRGSGSWRTGSVTIKGSIEINKSREPEVERQYHSFFNRISHQLLTLQVESNVALANDFCPQSPLQMLQNLVLHQPFPIDLAA